MNIFLFFSFCTLYFLSLTIDSAYSQTIKHYKIGTITIDRRKIFDSRDSTKYYFIGALANRLHILTKERIIRNELLFKEGDKYDQSLVEETERNLRRMGIIGDIKIKPDTVGDDINLTVETHDKWTLNLATSYKQEGGIQNFSLTFKDDNLFGNAQSLSFDYNYNSDRTNPYGTAVIFSEPRLFGTRWKTKLQYKNSESLNIKTILFEHPIFSDATTWAASGYADDSKEQIRYYQNGVKIQEGHIYQKNLSGWISHSLGRSNQLRFLFSYIRKRSQAQNTYLKTFDNIDLIALSINFMYRKYYKDTHIDNIDRVEDIPLGYLVNSVIGRNLHISKQSKPDYYFQFYCNHAFNIIDQYYLSYNMTISSFLIQGKIQEMTNQVNMIQHFKLPPYHTLVSRISFISGYRWSQNRQLTLGAPTGLRGYDAYRFNGQRLLLFNLEDRIFPKIKFWIFRFSGVLFFDSGIMWCENQSIKSQKFHSSFGFGLRIRNTKQQGSGMIRIDFPFNLDKHKLVEIIITTDQLFNAFSEIPYIAPFVF